MTARIRRVGGAVIPLALLLGLSAIARGQNTNLTWTGNGGDNLWTNIANWNGATYPNNGQPMATSSYNATVNSGTPTLNIDITIVNFTQGGGTISGPGNQTLNGLFTWTNGSLGGTGTTTLIFGSALYDGFVNRTIVSTAGAVNNVVGTGGLASVSTAAVWNNQLSSTFNLLSDSGLGIFQGSNGPGTFNNAGAFQKTGGTGISTIAWTFNNNSTGAVNVQSGTMNFSGNGTDTGTYTVSGGATLGFTGGTRALNGSVTGAGTVSISGATVTVGGSANAYAPSGDTTAISGTIAFNSAASANALHMTGGTIDGSAAFTVNGLLTWSSGQMGATSSPGAGTTTLNGGATISGGYLNRTLNNASGSTVTLPTVGGGLTSYSANATWNNQAGSVFTLPVDSSLTVNNGAGTFNNSGTFQKTAGTGTSTIAWNFNNTATVNAQTGTLAFSGGGTDTGSYTVSSGATLSFNGGTRALNAAVTGPGTVNFGGSANVTIGGVANAYNVGGDTSVTGGTVLFNSATSLTTLHQTGGTIDGTASLSVGGLFTWSGGNMGAQSSPGAGATTLNGGATLTGTPLFLGRGVINAAGSTVAFVNSGNLLSSSANATWTNQAGATFNLAADASLGASGGTGTFTNSGTFQKTAGTGTSTVVWNFINNGTVNAQTGTLDFYGGTDAGSYAVSSGATIGFVSGSRAVNGSVTGAGTVSVGTTVTVGGPANAYAVTGDTAVVSGTILFNSAASTGTLHLSGGAIDGSATFTVNNLFTWSGGTMQGAGVTKLNGGAALSPFGTLSLNRAVSQAGGTATFSTVNGLFYSTSANASWTTQPGATFTLAADASLFNNGGTGTFTNNGTFQKTAGTGTSTVQWTFNNGGTVNAQTGTLAFSGSGTDAGSYAVSSGAALSFTGGTRSLNGPVTGAGNVSFAGGTVTIGGAANAYAVTGDTSVTGTVLFNSASSTGTLHLFGTLDGTVNLTVNNLFTWTGGTMQGAGATTLNGGATLSNVASGLFLNRAVSEVGGTATFSSGPLFSNSAAATWTTQAGTTFTLSADASLSTNGGTGTFTNNGTFQKTGGTGTSTVSWNFSNAGTVTVSAATLAFANAPTLSNVAGTTLTGGAWHVVGPASGTTTMSFGNRDVQTLGNGATVILENANSAFTVNTSSAIDSRLTTLAAGSELEVLNGRSYSVANPSNAFTNSGTLLVSSNAGASTFTVGAGINLTNYNAATQTLSGGNWQVQGNATLNLGSRPIATIAAGTTIGLTTVGSTAATFPALTNNLATNNGTFQLLGGQNLTTAGSLTNTGTIQIASGGTLTVSGTLSDSGTVTGGTVVGNVQASGGTFSPGTVMGNVNFAGGSTTVPSGGAVSVSGTSTVQSGAMVTVASGATYGGSGSLVVGSGGTLTVHGTVNQPTTVAGILNGNSTFGSSLVIQSGGFIRPGNSPGMISVGGGLTLGGEYDWDINGNDNTLAGTTFDQVKVTGTTTLSAGQPFNVVVGAGGNFGNGFWVQSQTWPAVIASGGFTTPAIPSIGFDPTAFQAVFPGGSFALTEQSTALNVAWTPGAVRQSTFAATGDGHWNNPTNWNAPPLSGADGQLVFGPTAQPATMTNDIPGTFVLNALTFTAGSPAYTLTGNGLEFRTNATGSTPQIVNNSSNPVTIGVPLTLTNGLTVVGTGDVSLAAAVGGPGGLTMAGTGTLTLSAANSYARGTNIVSGTIAVAADTALGVGDVTASSPGALTFTGTTATARSFVMNGGTLSLAAGKTLTLNGGAITGAILDGGGTFVANGARFVGVTIAPSVVVTSTSPADQFVHLTNSGAVIVAAGVNSTGTSTVVNFNGFTNQGLGSLTIGATSQVNVANFQSYGTVTISPSTVTENYSQTTRVTNLGTAPLGFNGGSRTFIGTPATAVFPNTWPDTSLRGTPTFVAGIDLNGKNAVVAGGLFVNNGYVEDSSNGFAGTSTIVADFGSLVKGAGFFQNTVLTQNGGKFQAGNSPGSASFGKFVLGPGGVSSYVFAIDDATGAAGPNPDASGHVSGWGLVKAMSHLIGGSTTPGDFVWTATPSEKLIISLETLVNPTTVGTDVPGLMDHFDPTRLYVWPAVEWTGTYAGPADATTLDASTAFDVSGFANRAAGSFGWTLDTSGHTLSLTYTPTSVPEPGTLPLLSAVVVPYVLSRRRRRAPSPISLSRPLQAG